MTAPVLTADPHTYDWADLAFGSKKPLRELHAVFIAAPRELSDKRFKQLVMEYLPHGNIVLGISKEEHVLGFEGQAQFRMLEQPAVQKIINQVNTANKGRTVTTLHYFQRELPYILEKMKFRHVVLVNGSWQYVFHSSPAYYYLAASKTPYDMVSPFVDEAEAKAYVARIDSRKVKQLITAYPAKPFSEQEILAMANDVAKASYDYNFQTGVVLGKKILDNPGMYTFIQANYNKVVPYGTYAMHHGSLREKHFSPPNDLNYYDAVHAEMELLTYALTRKLDIAGTTLFINLLPCPTCARVLTETDITEFVYSIDHSDGYAVKLLEAAGKKVRRVVL